MNLRPPLDRSEFTKAPGTELMEERMQEARALSAHERRMQRMAERARRLEEQNVGEKEWFMRGEAGSGVQPSACVPAFS